MENNTIDSESRNGHCVIPAENTLSLTVQKCIKNIVEKENLKLYTVEVKNISTNGGNYLGDLQTVDIKGKGPDGDKEVNIFVKNTKNCEKVEHLSIYDVYYKESFAYKEILVLYDNLQEEYSVPQDDRLNIVKSYHEMNTEAIILENMLKSGFDTCNRRDVISLKFAEMSISQLAKYHALSFVVQQKRPRYFEKNMKHLKSSFKFGSSLRDTLSKLCNLSVDNLDGDTKVTVENYIPKGLEKYEEYMKISDGHEDGVCLGHGDFRANNILQKIVNDEITAVYPIDYQFISITTPVLDLIYFIFLGTDQKFRDAHLEYLKDYYYDSFERFLGYFDMKTDVYSRKRYEVDFRKYLDYGLMTSLFLTPLLFASDENVPDVNDLMEPDTLNIGLDNGFKERIEEIVGYFIQEGYL